MTAYGEITNWRSLAACMSADPDMFFPVSSVGPALKQIDQAKAICTGCTVRRACLDFALSTGQFHGVWGGTTEEERQQLRWRAAECPSTDALPGGMSPAISAFLQTSRSR